MKNLKLELKRAFSSMTFKLSLIIGFFIVFADLYLFYKQYGVSQKKMLNQAWIGLDFQFAYNQVFYILLPIIACLPYAGSLYQDIQSGYEKNICIKISRRSYILSKSIAVFVSAFVAVTLPLLANLFIAAGLYPNLLPEKLTWLSAGIIDVYRFSKIFHTHPVGYMLIFIVIDGLIAGLMGLMSLCVSRFCRSVFAVIMFPFVLYITTSMLFLFKDGTTWALMEIANPNQTYRITNTLMVAIYITMFIITTTVIWLFTRKRDVL